MTINATINGIPVPVELDAKEQERVCSDFAFQVFRMIERKVCEDNPKFQCFRDEETALQSFNKLKETYGYDMTEMFASPVFYENAAYVLKEDLPKKKTYKVFSFRVDVSGTFYVNVRAQNEDEAEEYLNSNLNVEDFVDRIPCESEWSTDFISFSHVTDNYEDFNLEELNRD